AADAGRAAGRGRPAVLLARADQRADHEPARGTDRAARARGARRRRDPLLAARVWRLEVTLSARFGFTRVRIPSIRSQWGGGRVRPGSRPARALAAIDGCALQAADRTVADTRTTATYLAELAGLPPERVEHCFVGAEERLFGPGW